MISSFRIYLPFSQQSLCSSSWFFPGDAGWDCHCLCFFPLWFLVLLLCKQSQYHALNWICETLDLFLKVLVLFCFYFVVPFEVQCDSTSIRVMEGDFAGWQLYNSSHLWGLLLPRWVWSRASQSKWLIYVKPRDLFNQYLTTVCFFNWFLKCKSGFDTEVSVMA